MVAWSYWRVASAGKMMSCVGWQDVMCAVIVAKRKDKAGRKQAPPSVMWHVAYTMQHAPITGNSSQRPRAIAQWNTYSQ
jgi:hypothetical protein